MSEDRVRDAVRAVFDVIHVESNVFFPPPGVYARCSAALRPYVTPAPALPAGTVVARLEWLRLMLTVAKQRDCTEIVDEIEGFLAKLPRPEPPKELVAECERLRAEVVRLRERVAFFNGAVPTMVQCFDTLVSGLDGNKHSVERSIKGLREYVAKLKADAALSTAQQGGNQ